MKPVFLSRRGFAATALSAPAALTQQVPSTPSEAIVQNPPLSNRLPPTGETMPFAETLSFTPNEAPRRQMPFPLSHVRLLPGTCLDAAEANRAYMLRLPPDRLLHNFLVNAGLPSSATPFGGWEAPKSELRGHFTGHYLSACALRAASAGDRELKARGDEIVAALARCQQQLGRDGYLSAFPQSLFERLERLAPVWAPFYTLHKIMAGLLDMYHHAGNRQALEVASRMADWAGRWTASKPPPLMQAILREEFGGMSEVLLSLSAAAREPRFAATADRFHKLAFLTPLAHRRDELRKLHANTHIPQILGAARRYELSSDARFRDVAEFFYHAVVSARTYSTGGSGNFEAWLTHSGPLSFEWRAFAHHQECCCAYNMMKLARMLYSWSGDPRYFDYYERNLFNHRLGAIQMSTGHSMYFLSLTPGAWKTLNTEDQTFWCCTGSALEEYSKLGDSIYSHGPDGLSVHLFIASTLDAAALGVGLRQDTKFPHDAQTSLTITASPAAPWTLRLRIPAWTQSPRITLNGQPLEGAPGPSSYFSLHRAWKPGDRVTLHFPMRLTVEPMPDDPSVQSFLYGPLVLAGDLGTEGLTDALIRHRQGPDVAKAPLTVPALRASGPGPESWLQPGTDPLSFRTAGTNPPLTLRPINQLWGRFAIYWPVA